MATSAGLTQQEMKEIFLIALEAKNGNITHACAAVGIVRQTYYNWLAVDEDFDMKVQALKIQSVEELVDESNDVIREHVVQRRDRQAAQFVLKHKGGYNEKINVQINSGQNFRGLEYPDEPQSLEDWEKLRDAQMKGNEMKGTEASADSDE